MGMTEEMTVKAWCQRKRKSTNQTNPQKLGDRPRDSSVFAQYKNTRMLIVIILNKEVMR